MRQSDLYVSSIDAPDERHHLLDNYSTASVVGDRLLYVTQGNTLMSQRLDLRRLRLEAETQAIVDGVQVWPVASRGLFSASDSGVIVYVPGRPANPYLQLTWMDRAGIVRRKLGEPARYGQLALSPDEKQVAVEIEMGEPPDHWDVWTFDVARGVPSRVTFGPANYRDPVWSPDGRELAYGVQQPNDMADLYRKSVGGTREEVPLVRDQTAKYPEQWLPGGVVYLTGMTSKDRRVWLRPLADNAPAQPLLGGGFFVDEPQVSPDGRWVAYLSDESGRREVYVEPFRRAGRRVRVSPDGGGQPKWRRDGRELYYVNANGKLVAVSVQPGEELTVGLPQPLFDIKPFQADQDDYAVSADGQLFLVKVPVDSADGGKLQVVVNSPALQSR
jgi:eukaryotic-like serine/threonine-protein kinase